MTMQRKFLKIHSIVIVIFLNQCSFPFGRQLIKPSEQVKAKDSFEKNAASRQRPTAKRANRKTLEKNANIDSSFFCKFLQQVLILLVY